MNYMIHFSDYIRNFFLSQFDWLLMCFIRQFRRSCLQWHSAHINLFELKHRAFRASLFRYSNTITSYTYFNFPIVTIFMICTILNKTILNKIVHLLSHIFRVYIILLSKQYLAFKLKKNKTTITINSEITFRCSQLIILRF